MRRLTQAGRDALEEFIVINDKDALYEIEHFDKYVKLFEVGGIVAIDPESSLSGKRVVFKTSEYVTEQDTTRIGIGDEIDKTLLSKRISEW